MFFKCIFSEIACVTDAVTTEKVFLCLHETEGSRKTETSACCVPRKLSEAEA